MFLSTKVKYPLLPIVSALKFSTQLIHSTSRNCFRGKPVKYTEPLEELYSSGNEIELASCKLNPNVNFFGIDSDEGVIVIDTKNSEKIVDQNNANKRKKEKFFRSSFGVIRQDSDNKIHFHGQYESAIDTFPHNSTDNAEVHGELHRIKSNIFNTSHNNKRENKLNDNNADYSFIKTYSAQNSHLESVYNVDKEEKLDCFANQNSVQYLNENVIDSDVGNRSFTEIDVNKLKSSSSQKVSPSIVNLKSSFNKDEVQNKFSINSTVNESDVNCIDVSVFQSIPKNDNFIKCDGITSSNVKECSADVSSSNLNSISCTDDITIGKRNLSSQPNENHMNYIEKYFFPNAAENNSSVKNQSVIHSDEKSFSYLDENYFGNILKDQKLADNANFQQSAETSNELPSDCVSPGTTSQCNIHNLSSVNDTKYFISESNKSSNDECSKLHIPQTSSDIPSLGISTISVKGIVSEHQVSDKTSINTNKSYFSNLNNVEKELAFNKSFNTSEVQYELNKQESSYTLNDCTANTQKSYLNEEYGQKYNDICSNSGVSESISNLNSNIRLNDVSHNLKTSTSVNKIEFSESRSTSDVSVTNDVHTAHTYVTELRKKQALGESEKDQEGIKNSSNLKFEKLDSKGFRILKNQVPDLSHFTREEVLDTLKSSVLYLDDNLLVLNKPYSLIMHDSQTTKSPCLSLFLDDFARKLDQQAADPKLFTVHRLDKETTGCLLLARNEITAQNLKSLFAQRKILKKYWIVTSRVPDSLKGIIDIPISEGSIHGKKRMVLHPDLPKDTRYRSHSRSGKRAVTSYKVLCISGNAALVEAIPETGIKHQIRVHFGFGLSCPILGDHKYSHIDKLAPQKLASDLLQRLYVRQSKVRYIPMHIHSKSITIPNYLEGRDLFIMAPLPSHMSTNLKKLKFKKRNQISL